MYSQFLMHGQKNIKLYDWGRTVIRLQVGRPRNLGSFPGGSRDRTAAGVQPPSCTAGNGGVQPGLQAEHSVIHLSSTDVKNEWSCTSFPPYVFGECYFKLGTNVKLL